MKFALAVIVSAAIAAALTVPIRATPRPHEHWHYANCDLIVRYCVLG